MIRGLNHLLLYFRLIENATKQAVLTNCDNYNKIEAKLIRGLNHLLLHVEILNNRILSFVITEYCYNPRPREFGYLVKIYFGQIKIQVKFNINRERFQCVSLSNFVFSTLYTTLPHDLIKDKLINLQQRRLSLPCM